MMSTPSPRWTTPSLVVETTVAEVRFAADSNSADRRGAVNMHRAEPPSPPEQIPGYDQATVHHERWSPARCVVACAWIDSRRGRCPPTLAGRDYGTYLSFLPTRRR